MTRDPPESNRESHCKAILGQAIGRISENDGKLNIKIPIQNYYVL